MQLNEIKTVKKGFIKTVKLLLPTTTLKISTLIILAVFVRGIVAFIIDILNIVF